VGFSIAKFVLMRGSCRLSSERETVEIDEIDCFVSFLFAFGVDIVFVGIEMVWHSDDVLG
jgi:hypothetical protein